MPRALGYAGAAGGGVRGTRGAINLRQVELAQEGPFRIDPTEPRPNAGLFPCCAAWRIKRQAAGAGGRIGGGERMAKKKAKNGQRGAGTESRNQAPETAVDAGDFSLAAQAPPEEAGKARAPAAARAPGGPRRGDDVQIASYRHLDKRKNNPEVGMVKPENDPIQPKTVWTYDPHLDPVLQFDIGRAAVEKLIDEALASGDEAAMRAALQELKRLGEPYLAWTGKAERTSFEIDTVSLHVHERIDPASILSAVRRKMNEGKSKGEYMQPDLFAAPFENLPLRDAIDFYKHERGWANRLVAGDSLLVMNSLLQKEGMAGQVQMIYIDPPYGIKYGSNFQPFVNKRDVKDRRDEDLTQEPEMIKAFRDTWELGIHSYLTYLRDRLLLAKELLHESGSVFVQISDENAHLIRNLLDDVFGVQGFCAEIAFRKTSGIESELLASSKDWIIWYAKDRAKTKFRPLYLEKVAGESGAEQFDLAEESSGYTRRATPEEMALGLSKKNGVRLLTHSDPTAVGNATTTYFDLQFRGDKFTIPPNRRWRSPPDGMARLDKAGRMMMVGQTVRFRKYLSDYPVFAITDWWSDTGISGFGDKKVYVVQTAGKVIERCLLMTTDPGDLVLDPTCGSGTSAFVAEKWGRRWITCDTSRVAVTLAKQRLMTASYDYYALRYPQEGLRGGFIYKTVPHVTLKSIANNPEIDEIHERLHPAVESALAELNKALQSHNSNNVGRVSDAQASRNPPNASPSPRPSPARGEGELKEWEVPFDFPEDWPPAARKAFDAFHGARQAMQKKMDDSIAAHADQETLYDQPQPDRNKLRISGPFTVEAVPFPTVLALDETKPAQEADVAIARSGESSRQHQWRDELLKTGIRGKGGQILRFAELETLPGTRYLHVSGHLDSGERAVVSFGPEHAALEQRAVALALNDAEKLRPAPKFIIFAAFEFDPEAAKDIDETQWPGVTLLKAKMNTDLLTEDLKKARSGNQSFWLMGQPDVEVHRQKDGKYVVEVHGFDYFDTATGELVSGGKGKIAAWMLDTDYDERSLFPRQVFFPMAGKGEGWEKLKKDIRAELNEALLDKFHGTKSLPFEAGDNKKVAVKIVDDRGIESLKIIALD